MWSRLGHPVEGDAMTWARYRITVAVEVEASNPDQAVKVTYDALVEDFPDVEVLDEPEIVAQSGRSVS